MEEKAEMELSSGISVPLSLLLPPFGTILSLNVLQGQCSRPIWEEIQQGCKD